MAKKSRKKPQHSLLTAAAAAALADEYNRSPFAVVDLIDQSLKEVQRAAEKGNKRCIIYINDYEVAQKAFVHLEKLGYKIGLLQQSKQSVFIEW